MNTPIYDELVAEFYPDHHWIAAPKPSRLACILHRLIGKA